MLVRRREGAEAEEVVCGSADILRWVDAELPGASLSPPADSPAGAAVRTFLALAEAVDAEDMAYAFGGVVTHAQVTLARLRTVKGHLTALAEDAKAEERVRDAARARAAAIEERIASWQDGAALRARVEAAVLALLDALEAALELVGSGPFAAGAQYTLADVALTVFLAHARRHAALAEHVHARRRVSLYFTEVLLPRPSFAAADVWTGARCGKVPEVVAGALTVPLRALGAAWHDHVAVPVASTRAYKAAAEAWVDIANSTRVPVEEEVKPAIAHGVDACVVRPAHAAGAALHACVLMPTIEASAVVAHGMQQHVITPCAAAAHATGEAVSGAVHRVAEMPPVRATGEAVAAVMAPVVRAGHAAGDFAGEQCARAGHACARAGAAIEVAVTPVVNGVMDATLVRIA